MVGQGSGDQPSGNLAADRIFLGLRTTDPDARTGIVQLYVKDTGGGQMTLFSTQPLELGGASQEIAGLSQAEVEALIEADTQGVDNTWRYKVISTINDPVLFGTDGQRYLIGTAPTGSWSANADDVAVRDGAGDVWKFQVTQEGYRIFDIAVGVWRLFVGGAWAVEGGIVAIWERVSTTISPVNSGDDLDLENGDLQNVARFSGGGGAQTIIEGDDTPGDSVSLRGSSDSARPALEVVDQTAIGAVLEDASGQSFVVQDDQITPDVSLRAVAGGALRAPLGTHVGEDTEPTASAVLQASSTTQGFLPPVMDETERDAISSPAGGLMIFNTDTNQWNGYNGTSWVVLG